jgi:hypothetical protein
MSAGFGRLCSAFSARSDWRFCSRGLLAVDELERRVRAFVYSQTAWSCLDVPAETDLVYDAGICGDDLWELVDEFARRFDVRMDGFRWYHHSAPEGCNPLWLLFKPWWARKTRVPIRLSDLVMSARSGEWGVQYPESEAEPAETEEDRHHTRIGCAIMAGVVFVIAATFAVLRALL